MYNDLIKSLRGSSVVERVINQLVLLTFTAVTDRCLSESKNNKICKFLLNVILRVNLTCIISLSSMHCACADVSSAAFRNIQYFPTLSHKPHRLGQKKIKIKHKLYFDFLCNFCLKTFLILRRTGRDMIKMCACSILSSVACPALQYFSHIIS